MDSKTKGYSNTPLVKKLGIKSHSIVLLQNEPAGYRDWLEPLPEAVIFDPKAESDADVVHIFCDSKALLKQQLDHLRPRIKADCAIWVSWPKKAAKIKTDVTEDRIREVALPLGFVDIKVCAVTEIWSGLKLVIRKELR